MNIKHLIDRIFMSGQKLPDIRFCDLSLAYQCNLECKICFFWKDNPFNAENTLSGAQWEEALRQIHSLPGSQDCFISLTGAGEALLHPHIFRLLELADELGLRVQINSNGYAINENIAKKLGKANLKHLSLSVDSLNASVHDELRGKKGCFEKVIKAIDLITEFSPSAAININTVINKLNQHEIIDMAQWAQDDPKISSISFFAINEPFSFKAERDNDWFKKQEFQHLWPDDPEKINDLIDRLIDLKHKGHKMRNSPEQLELIRDYFLRRQKPDCNLKDINRLVIDPVGNISICSMLGVIGNIKEQTDLCQTLSSKTAKEHIKNIKTCDKRCSTC